MSTDIDNAIEEMAFPNLETGVSENSVYEVYGSWSKHVESWTRKSHRAIYVMRYENMLADPFRIFGGLARHLLLRATDDQPVDCRRHRRARLAQISASAARIHYRH
jgi:Sulfotransferase domain